MGRFLFKDALSASFSKERGRKGPEARLLSVLREEHVHLIAMEEVESMVVDPAIAFVAAELGADKKQVAHSE